MNNENCNCHLSDRPFHGLDANGDAYGFDGYDRGGQHAGQAPKRLVEKSTLSNLCKEGQLRKLLAKTASTEFRGATVLQRVGRIRASAMNTLRAMGRAGGGTVIGAIAIFSALSANAETGQMAESFGRNMREGNRAYADLDAIAIALSIQEMGGNYFVTMYALDILLADPE